MTSIGKDLATIRKHLGYTLEEMNQKTRIPLETLERIENDTLLEEDGSNKIYARGFIRTYAKALKIDDESILYSLDQSELGNYNGLLLESFPELKQLKLNVEPGKSGKGKDKGAKKTVQSNSDKKKDIDSTPETSREPVTPKEMEKRSVSGRDKDSTTSSKKTPADDSARSSITDPTVDRYNWAQVGSRLNNNQKRVSPWIIGVIVILLILIAAIYFIYNSEEMGLTNNMSVTETSEPQAPNTPDGAGLSLELEEETAETDEPAAPAELDETLYLTLFAAYDVLEPVRVYSDLKPRLDPYWMEQGDAFNFEFRDTIRISGQYNRMLLFLNGHRIENFRQNYFNQEEGAVELTRDIFEADSEWAVPVPLDLPEAVPEPDSIQLRPFY